MKLCGPIISPFPGRIAKALAALLGLGLAVNAIIVACWGTLDITYTRGLIVYVSVVASLLSSPLAASFEERSQSVRALAWAVDLLLIIGFSISIYFFLSAADNLNTMLMLYSTRDIFIGLGGGAILLEATRRLFGLPIVLFIVVVFCYGLWGEYLPDPLAHTGFSLSSAMEMIWYGFQGVFGTPLSIVIEVVLIFIVFGLVLEGTGASNSLIRIAFALTGRSRGGVAQAAILSSAMFGSMSGSVVANVVGTGSFTIPMMIRRGFRPAMAGAVEAAASTGGQIMPPVMGAAAFLMADLLNVSYLTVCAAALVPSVLYIGSLFLSVSLGAGRDGLKPIPKEERETIDRATLLQSLMFVVPILVIVLTLVGGSSPARAGFVAVISAIVMGLFVNPEFRRNPRHIIGALMRGGLAGASIVIVVAAIGVILGVLNLTGLGLTFASTVAALGQHNLLLALLLTAGTCLILGMGMPTLSAYLIIVLVMGRSLRELGIEPLALHMFVLYFGVLSAITPPVAVAVFAAAPIAKAHPLETAVSSIKIAFIGFVIPFIFVVEPSLLMVTSSFRLDKFLIAMLAMLTVIGALATAFYGYDFKRLALPRRIFRTAIGFGPIAALLAGHYELQVVVLCFSCLLVDLEVSRRVGKRGERISSEIINNEKET